MGWLVFIRPAPSAVCASRAGRRMPLALYRTRAGRACACRAARRERSVSARRPVVPSATDRYAARRGRPSCQGVGRQRASGGGYVPTPRCPRLHTHLASRPSVGRIASTIALPACLFAAHPANLTLATDSFLLGHSYLF